MGQPLREIVATVAVRIGAGIIVAGHEFEITAKFLGIL